MSFKRASDAAVKLAKIAADRLAVNEQVYGSADNYVERKPKAELITYVRRRIDEMLNTLAEKPDASVEILLSDCFNHLCFVMARADLDAQQNPATQEVQDDHA